MSQITAIRDTLAALIQSEFGSAYPNMPVFYENQKFDPPIDKTWIMVSILPGYQGRENIGNEAHFKSLGVVNIQIMTPEAKGTREPRLAADTLFEILADRQTPIPGAGSVTTYGVSIRTRGLMNSLWTMVVQCEYRAFITLDR